MAISASQFEQIRKLVAGTGGLLLPQGSEGWAEERIEELARFLRLNSVIEFFRQLEKNAIPDVGFLLSEVLANKETSFFRDGLPFEAFRKELIPALRERRSEERVLRIWSAGCSTGQEPFSLAILVRQHVPDLKDWTLEIHATDLAEDVLLAAQRGAFSQAEVNRGLPAPLLVKYFQKAADKWQLKDEILEMVQFRQINLAEPWPELPPMDVVFLRYVLSNLTTEAREKIARELQKVLRPDGYLVVGNKESVPELNQFFYEIPLGKSVGYRRKG